MVAVLAPVLVLIPVPMLVGLLSELFGGLTDGRYLGIAGLVLLILGAILSWVRLPVARARIRRLQQRGH